MKQKVIYLLILVSFLVSCATNNSEINKSNLLSNDNIAKEDSDVFAKLNPHRKTDDDLFKLLETYTIVYEDIYEFYSVNGFRIRLTDQDPHAIYFVLPEHSNYMSERDKNLISLISKGDYSIKYTWKPSMYVIDSKSVEIESDGTFQASIAGEYDKLLVTSPESGQFNKKSVEKALIDAVRYGLFELPPIVEDLTVLDATSIYFEFVIGEEVFRIGGYYREYYDDVFYKVKGDFLRIIEEQVVFNED